MEKGIFRGLQSTGKWVIILIAGTVLTGLFALSVATRATIAIDEHTYFLMDGILYRVGAVMLCAAFVLVFRTQKAEKQYAQHLRRVAGGDVPTGTYEFARAMGEKSLRAMRHSD